MFFERHALEFSRLQVWCQLGENSPRC
jgi:hypothetical protein